jgi:cytidine deaminase
MSNEPEITNQSVSPEQSASMPEREPYQSIWFPPGFVKDHCDPKSLVKGLHLPDTLQVPICPENITHTITSELGALTRDLAHHYKVTSFTTLLTDQGHLFFGMPRNHAHPNCYGHSVECATGVAVTSGHHSFPLVVTYEKDTERPPFDGLVLERLAEHFVPGCNRSMKLLHVSDVGETLYEHNSLLPFPHGGVSRPHVSPRPSAAHKKLDFSLSADDVCNLQIERNSLRAIARELRAIVHNSSADGETRPGRKRHAACVFTADGDAYFGVNLRADVRAADRCAEWNALSAALVGGDKERIAGVMVYSPDYEEGAVCCCGKCLNSLGDFIDPNIGDMMIAYMGRTSIDALKLYTEVRNTSYGEAEGRSLRRS